jgi:hypothetical protein
MTLLIPIAVSKIKQQELERETIWVYVNKSLNLQTFAIKWSFIAMK